MVGGPLAASLAVGDPYGFQRLRMALAVAPPGRDQPPQTPAPPVASQPVQPPCRHERRSPLAQRPSEPPRGKGMRIVMSGGFGFLPLPSPILDTTSDHRSRNGQITRRLRVGRRRHCPSRSSLPTGPWPESLGRRACCPARGSPACCAPRPWRAGVRPRPEMRDEPGRTRPGDAWYVRCRFASFPKPVEGKACRS
jgi:hypothetical protein